MDKTSLRRYKGLLLEKRRELSSVRGLVPAAGGWEGDLIDQANADVEADFQIRLQETDARLLQEVEEALARVKDGTYGVCANCNQIISRARLKAVPWTRLCRPCMEVQDG
jgi:DnaK suppressor protein